MEANNSQQSLFSAFQISLIDNLIVHKMSLHSCTLSRYLSLPNHSTWADESTGCSPWWYKRLRPQSGQTSVQPRRNAGGHNGTWSKYHAPSDRRSWPYAPLDHEAPRGCGCADRLPPACLRAALKTTCCARRVHSGNRGAVGRPGGKPVSLYLRSAQY